MSKYEKYKIQNSQELPTSKYAKYKIMSEAQESPSFLDRAKQFGKGVLSGFSRSALEEAGNQAKYGVMEIAPGVIVPIAESSATANIPQKGIESLDSMRPSQNDSLGNILHHAGEFGGAVANFPIAPGRVAGQGAKSLLSRFAKDVGTGTTIGGISGALQNTGVNPLAADIGTTLALPLGMGGAQSVGRGTRNLLRKFTTKGKKEVLNADVGELLKKRIGEENIPSVLSKLENKGPLGTNLTTAELTENPGLAGLHRALSPNIPAITEKNIANNALIKNKLQSLGNTELTAEMAGENIRRPLASNLENAIKKRAEVTKPLYEKVNELTEGVDLPGTRAFLNKESKLAKGDIKKNLSYVEDIIRSNKSPKVKKEGFEKLYGNFGSEARSQLQKEILGNPVPAELSNALKDISGRIGAARKSGNNEVARTLMQARENILADMAAIPEEQLARSTYANLSKPVSAIEKEPLLKKIVKKDEFAKDFLLSPEKIPDLILNGTVNNTKALIGQLGSNKNALNTVRGSIVNKLLGGSELSNAEQNLSYDKVSKFLKKNKAKLDLIFEPEQVKVLEDTREILRRRNVVQTLGRAAGSNTQSETTLLNDLLGTGTNKVLREAAAYTIPGGGLLYDVAKDTLKRTKTQATKELLEKALLDPETARLLLTPTKNLKDPGQLNNILERLYPNLTVPITNELNTRERE